MPDNSIDAIKVARAIQKNELSILDGKEFKVRDKINKKKRRGRHVKNDKPKYTLNEIGGALFEFIKTTNTRFDNLEKDVNSLKQDVEGLKQDIKSINTHLDKVEKRLDYNDLKQLPTSNK